MSVNHSTADKSVPVPDGPVGGDVLIIGHSHVACIASACKQSDCSGFRFLQLFEERFKPNVVPKEDGADTVVNPVLKFAIQTWQDELGPSPDQPARLMLSLEGNQHSVLGMVNHPEPFDFVLPEATELALTPGARIIPFQAMRAIVLAKLNASFQLAGKLQEAVTLPMSWLSPPPPIAEADYILQHPGVFRETVTLRGVSPATFRYKLWRLQVALTSEWCQNHGVDFLEVPEEARDERGFLARQAWTFRDPTHGNEWYGRLVLGKIHSSPVGRSTHEVIASPL